MNASVIAPQSVEQLSARCWELRELLDDAKRERAPMLVLYSVAQDYIDAVCAFQKAKYGKVRTRPSRASVLR